MSIRIMSQVWQEQRLTGGRLLVMLALADFADDNGYCFPSMASIGAKCRMSDRAARMQIRCLETGGFLRLVKSSGRRSNTYQIILNPEQGSLFNPEETSRKKLPRKRSNPEVLRIQPGSGLPPNRQEPSLDKKDSSKSNRLSEFEDWYSHYPRKEAKGAARKAFVKARRAVDMETLIAGAKRYVTAMAGKDRQFIALPATWLNAERWADEGGTEMPLINGHASQERRVEVAKDWLSRNDSIPTWMDHQDTAKVLLAGGYDYERLRRAGFSLPPRGNVVDIGAMSAKLREA